MTREEVKELIIEVLAELHLKPQKPTSFERSVHYNREKWDIALKDWSPEKREHYYLSADNYSNKGHVFINWVKAVRNWDKMYPYETRKNKNDIKGMFDE